MPGQRKALSTSFDFADRSRGLHVPNLNCAVGTTRRELRDLCGVERDSFDRTLMTAKFRRVFDIGSLWVPYTQCTVAAARRNVLA